MTRYPFWWRMWLVLFAVPSFGGGQSPRSRQSRKPDPDVPVTVPKWLLAVQYLIASAFCLVFLGLLVLDPFLPDYDVPPLLYMFMLVVIVFALPGSEKIATTLINAIFRRKLDE